MEYEVHLQLRGIYVHICLLLVETYAHTHTHTCGHACQHMLLVDECSFKCNCIQLLLNSIFFNFLPDFIRWYLCLLASVLLFADSDSRILCFSAECRVYGLEVHIYTHKYAYAYEYMSDIWVCIYVCVCLCVCVCVHVCCWQKCLNISLSFNG